MASVHSPKIADATDAAANRTVLFITRKWGPAIGGMETYCERLTEELAKLQPVEVVALKGQSSGAPPSVWALLLFPFTVLVALIRRSPSPALIHLGDMAIWPLGVLAKALHPSASLAISAHGTDVAYGARKTMRGKLYGMYLKIGARILSRIKVIANSHATRERLQAIGWTCDAVVPLATDLRAEGDANFDSKEIVFAGRLVTRKGLAWFVETVLPLLPQDIRVSVIGTRWDASEEAALEHPQVNFLGGMAQDQLALRFAKAACVIVPNIELENGEYEGFGLVAPEAASAGGVVIAAASGGLIDAVRDGETGFLIAPQQPQQWADKITEVLDWDAGQRAQFLKRSQELAHSHYSWERVALETSKVYGQ